MEKIILDEALKAKLVPRQGPTELCDIDGNSVGVILSNDEYRRLVYDSLRAEFSTPEAETRRQEALDAYRRGDCITSDRLFAEIDALVKRRAAS